MNIPPFLRGCGIVVTAAGLFASPSHTGLSEATDFGGPWSTAGIQYDIGELPSTGVYWVERSETTLDGTDAVEGTLGGFDAVQSWLETQMTGPGTVSFWYRCDERGVASDRTLLRLYLGPVSIHQPLAQFEETAWTQCTLNIPPGSQLVTWGAFRMTVFQETTPILHTYLDEVVFTPTIVPPQSTFPAWTTAWNVGGQPVSTDTDGDGLDLLMEYATGGSPYTPNPELLPSASIVDGYFTLRFTKAPSPTDLIHFAQEPILHLRVLVLTTP